MPISIDNIFAGIAEQLPQELESQLASGRRFRLNRIVSRGHRSGPDDWYDQTEAEWVILLSGSAGLEFEGEKALAVLHPGDHVMIPAHCRHRVAWTAPDTDSVWLAVYFDQD